MKWTRNILIIVIGILPACEKNRLPDNHTPVASFSTNVTSGDRPLEVNFDATLSSDVDGDSLNYSWDMGDGGTDSGALCAHTFEKTGSFTVTLTVADEEGLEDQASIAINVDEPPDIFPAVKEGQWVYHVTSTRTQNGKITEKEEGTMYLVVDEYREENGTDYITLRVTGKRRYGSTLLGDYIYLTHEPGNALMVSRNTDDPPMIMINWKESSWKDYCMFFSGPYRAEQELKTSTVELDLGNFESFRVRFHTDNWGQNYVSERTDYTHDEYIYPGIGLVYRSTSSYFDFLDCFYCPVYGGSSEVILTGYHLRLADGTEIEKGSGHNIDNPYGGSTGLKTIYTGLQIGSIKVYLDGEFVGNIGNSHSEGVVCDQEDALNVYRESGVYQLIAESTDGHKWVGDITFVEGMCNTVNLHAIENTRSPGLFRYFIIED